ncbi:MAG TPA: Spy/CpxP family protein refolding chaperone [Candidatus Omnitrophota bacterium]|nr:Spy/CpxP family protein refolding chaperone [Candidatus Omnitrophota bacterium]
MDQRFIKRTAVFLGLILSFFLVSSVNVYAEKDNGKMGEHKKDWEEKVNKMYDELGLTPEQRTALKQHKETHRGEMKALREQIQAKREELKNEIQKADFDEGKVRAISNEVNTLQGKMAEHRLNGMFEVRKILTPEQFTKFQELKEDHKGKFNKERFKERLEHRKEGMPGK